MPTLPATLLLSGDNDLFFEQVRSALVEAGIPAVLTREDEGVVTEVWVPHEHRDAAFRLVNERFGRTPVAGSRWWCPSCSAANEPGFDLCWSCGTERTSA